MLIKGLADEDFVNYKKPSMYIAFPWCSFKCDKEAGCAVCQNSTLAHEPSIEVSMTDIIARYMNNPITKAIVFGGLEPWDSRFMAPLVSEFRKYTDDDIIIYTGYTETELTDDKMLQAIQKHPNVIVKFGRFIPNQEKHYDEILGVQLASPNQYAKRIS